MEIAVDRAAEVLANELPNFEVDLDPTDQIDVQRVESDEQRLQAEPVPAGNAAAQELTPSLVALVVKTDAIVRVGHLDRRHSRRQAIEARHEIPRCLREIAANLEHGNEFPIGGQRRIERA